MCGIAGFVGDQPVASLTTGVERMMDRMRLRGPDSAGIHSWPQAVLGHRRLAILDLSPAGAQPYISDDGQTGLVFNGCIYNFHEVREELTALGHRFKSQCDTEVLLRGFEQWGIDALMPRLRGMFAFAFWEARSSKLTLVRDRLGVKPLAFAASPSGIAFASTVSALRAAGLGGDLSPQAILEFFEFGFVTDASCIYQKISKVPPATIIEWQSGQLRQRVYWSLPEPTSHPLIGFEEAVEETERLLIESVRLRLIADVPVGALLSGGIDSSLVCWAMSRLNANVKAFTVGAAGDPSDESAEAASTARQLGIEHEIIQLPQETPAILDDLAQAYSEPLGANSAVAMLLVSKAVKPSATVMLTGDGGDDVFLGYPFQQNALTAQRLARALPATVAKLWPSLEPLVPPIGPLRRARNLMNYSTSGLRGHALAHDGLPFFQNRQLLGPKLAGLKLDQREIQGSLESSKNLFQEVFNYHRKMHFLSEFMPKVDGGSMFSSLEARAPFLDQKLWEFAAALPPALRLNRGTPKSVLREITRRHLGPEVAFRSKKGFTVPVETLLATKWRAPLERLREGTILQSQGWIDGPALDKTINSCLAKGHVPLQLWFVLTLEHWLRKQGEHA